MEHVTFLSAKACHLAETSRQISTKDVRNLRNLRRDGLESLGIAHFN